MLLTEDFCFARQVGDLGAASSRSPVEAESKLLAPPEDGLVGWSGSLASWANTGEASESEVTATSLYICSISGVIKPWLMVLLDLARKERR